MLLASLFKTVDTVRNTKLDEEEKSNEPQIKIC
jgi:hypothetical protein